MVLSYVSEDEILKCVYSSENHEQCGVEVLVIMLCKVVLTQLSLWVNS